MTGFGLQKNMDFDWSGTHFRIDRLHKNGDVLLERMSDGCFSISRRELLLEEYAKGNISSKLSIQEATIGFDQIFSRPLDELSEKIKAEVLRRRHYLDAITHDGPPVFTIEYLKPLVKQAAEKIQDNKPPSVTSLYRWYRRLQSSRDTRALIPRSDLRGPRTFKQSDELLRLANSSIEEAFKISPLANCRTIYTLLISKIEVENRHLLPSEQIKPPCLRTLYRLLSNMEAYSTSVLKHGKAVSDKRYRLVKHTVRTRTILERVEIDHTPLDLFLIDEETGLPLGRPTLTVVIDHFSRMLLGYYLSYDNPSTGAVIGALRHAILPKKRIESAIPGIEIEHYWICYGCFDLMVLDNALEFHGYDLESVAYDLGIRILFCPKHQPRFKGVVERYLKTVNYFFAHQIPGTSFSRFYKREDYDSQKHALLTLREFNFLFQKWVLDVYAQTVHRGIGTTPWMKWNEGLIQREPELPADIYALKQRIGLIRERSLRADGILLNGIRYNGDGLAPILRAYGIGVQVRVSYDPEDLGEIQVWGPSDSHPVTVAALDQSHAKGLTHRQNTLIRAVQRQKEGKSEGISLERARHEISSGIMELMKSRKQRDRRRSGAIRGLSSASKEPSSKAAPPASPGVPIKNKDLKPIQQNPAPPMPALLTPFQLKRQTGSGK